MRRTPFTLLALFVASTLAAGVLALISHEPRVASPAVLGVQKHRDDDKVTGRDKRNFRVSGDVDGLFPGATVALDLLVTNPNNFPIRVTDLQIDVGDGDTGCPATALAVEPFSGMADVPKNGSAVHTLDVTMAPTAGDACKNNTFLLRYSGTAVKP